MLESVLDGIKGFLFDVPLETWFIVVGVLLLLTIFIYLVYSGLLSPVTVSTSDTKFGPMTFAYKTHKGPYKNVGEVFTESFCLVPEREQLGIYYDDPEGVSPDQLRAAVGPILALGEEKADPEEMEKVTKEGFKIAHLPKPSFVVTASFPFRSTLSIFIAIYKVYPKLRDYISERNLCAYPAMEVYTDSNIIFLMPLSRQEEFFVPEFQDDLVSSATTEMTGSVIAGEGVRDKDGFLIPQTPRSTGDDSQDATEDDVAADEEETTEEEDNSIGTEDSARSRDS